MGVPPMMVTKEARNAAKAVNFGIVYGISGFGLAANLGIPRKEAEAYIRGYFERYAGVKRFIDSTIAANPPNWSCENASGPRTAHSGHEQPQRQRTRFRRTNRHEFTHSGHRSRSDQAGNGEDRQVANGKKSKLLLQVHDELVLESPRKKSTKSKHLVRSEMENVMELNVPLVVDIGTGENWRDAK